MNCCFKHFRHDAMDRVSGMPSGDDEVRSMTFRLCVFGNSHVASMRAAWAVYPGRWPGLDARFVGAHGKLLLETEIRQGKLVPVTNSSRSAFQRLGGVDEVDLAAFDGFVIAGCVMAMPQAAMVYRDMRWPDLPSLDQVPDLAAMRQTLVSYAAARTTLEAVLSRKTGPRFAAHLRAGTDRPIWMASQPRMSEAGRAPRATRLWSYVAALTSGDGAGLSALFEDGASRAAVAAGAEFLSQPPHTIKDHILTKLAYVKGAVRLTPDGNLPQPRQDMAHANAAYGAAVLDQIAGIVG
jgi:hypothetical protein